MVINYLVDCGLLVEDDRIRVLHFLTHVFVLGPGSGGPKRPALLQASKFLVGTFNDKYRQALAEATWRLLTEKIWSECQQTTIATQQLRYNLTNAHMWPSTESYQAALAQLKEQEEQAQFLEWLHGTMST